MEESKWWHIYGWCVRDDDGNVHSKIGGSYNKNGVTYFSQKCRDTSFNKRKLIGAIIKSWRNNGCPVVK
jgi:hypothetical protein